MNEISGAEALLLETLGLPFLAFVLNAPPADIELRLQVGTALPEPQETVLKALVTFLGTLPQAQSGDPFSLSLALGQLAQNVPTANVSWAIAARQAANGDVTLPTTSDPLSQHLLLLTRDLYPLFLLPPASEDARFHLGPPLTAPLYSHPSRQAFEDAVSADETLARLFPDQNEHTGHNGMIYRSTGSGGSIQLTLIADSILRSGWRQAQLKIETPSLAQFSEAVLATIGDIRKAIKGQSMKVTALVGIAGLRLPANSSVTLPWGRLREATDKDRALFPPGLAGSLSGTTQDGKPVVIDYAGDLVMELEVPYKIKIVGSDQPRPLSEWPLEPVSAKAIDECLETLRLGLLLSAKGDSRPIVVGTWRTFFEPLDAGRSMSWNDPRRGPSLSPAVLSTKEVNAWKEWIERVATLRNRSIDVAIRRTLMAASDRPDLSDALVDAVIAWENLVGSREGEVTLRVAASLAWLLASSPAKRKEIRRKVAALYGVRSDIVHGNRFLAPREAFEKRQEALDITLDVLRIMFKNRPELLATGVDGANRSLMLMLNDRGDAKTRA